MRSHAHAPRERAPSDQERFAALWAEQSARVQAYVLRRVGENDAEEIVADVFLVAWRRLEDVPAEPLPWLLVVARNTIANHWRALTRRSRLARELARVAELASAADGPDVGVAERDALVRALAQLSAREREALLLVGWDGLGPEQAATVAGCSAAAFRMRMSRARRALVKAAERSSGGARVRGQSSEEAVYTVREALGGAK